MLQMGRNLIDEESASLTSKRYLIIDRETKYTCPFRRLVEQSGTDVIRLPPKSPNLNAHTERFIRSIKYQCLRRMIFIGEASLRRAIGEYMARYHEERNHQGLGNRLIRLVPPRAANAGCIQRHRRLGGMLNYYYRAAARAFRWNITAVGESDAARKDSAGCVRGGDQIFPGSGRLPRRRTRNRGHCSLRRTWYVPLGTSQMLCRGHSRRSSLTFPSSLRGSRPELSRRCKTAKRWLRVFCMRPKASWISPTPWRSRNRLRFNPRSVSPGRALTSRYTRTGPTTQLTSRSPRALSPTLTHPITRATRTGSFVTPSQDSPTVTPADAIFIQRTAWTCGAGGGCIGSRESA
jgi:hypothetical protein